MRKSPSKKRAPAKRSILTLTVDRRDGKVVRLQVTGHADFAAAGEDIVCAAVSALVMSAAYGVVRHCGAAAAVSDDPDGAYVLEVPDGGDARVQAVLETALSGLQAIARSYPEHAVLHVNSTGAGARRAEKPGPRKGA